MAQQQNSKRHGMVLVTSDAESIFSHKYKFINKDNYLIQKFILLSQCHNVCL